MCPSSGPLPNFRVVHKPEGLGRNGSGWAGALANQWFRGIEDLHGRNELAAFDRKINAPATAGFIQGPRPERGGIEGTGDPEQGVANGLGFEPAWNTSRQE